MRNRTADDGRRTADGAAPSSAVCRLWSVVPYHASRFTFHILAVIVLLGLGVRLFGLTSYGIWFDEGYHIALVRLPTVGHMLDAVLSNPPSDPLYVLMLRVWVNLFGYEDAAVRALSVLMSTVAVLAAYWLGSVVAGPTVGLLGALLFALSPYGVELGQEAALYSLAALTTTLALAAGWRWRTHGRGAGLYIALGVLAIYSHYVVAAILALFALFALHSTAGPRRVSTRQWLLANAAIFAAWLPWLVALGTYWVASPLPRATLHHPAKWSDLYGALVQLTSGTAALSTDNGALQALGLLAGALLLALGIRAASGNRGLGLLAAVAAVIFLAPALVSSITGMWLFVSHFMLFLLPAMLVVLAAGFVSHVAPQQMSAEGRMAAEYVEDRHSSFFILHSSFPMILFGAALAVFLVAQTWGLALYYLHPPHGADGLRELATTLNRDVRPGDVVATYPAVQEVTLSQYYRGEVLGLPEEVDLRAIYLPYDAEQWSTRTLERLEEATGGMSVAGQRLWLVYTHTGVLDAGGSLLDEIKRRYRLVEQYPYPYGTLYRFEAR